METANEMPFNLRRGIENGCNYYAVQLGNGVWLAPHEFAYVAQRLTKSRCITTGCEIVTGSNRKFLSQIDPGCPDTRKLIVTMKHGDAIKEFEFPGIDYLADPFETICERLTERIRAVRAWEDSLDHTEVFEGTLGIAPVFPGENYEIHDEDEEEDE